MPTKKLKDAALPWRPGTTPGSRWLVEKCAPNIHKIIIETPSREMMGQKFLLSGDRHHDNQKCDQELELAHLKEAKRQNAIIIDVGDLFCAMQGKWDGRASRDDLREEHQHGDYLDRLVKTAAEFYKPFASNFAIIGRGNHETSIQKHHETDLVERLCAELSVGGLPVHSGSYTGWIHVVCIMGGCTFTMKIKYHHGYGSGGSPMSHDTLKTRREASAYDGVDIFLSGHTHNLWNLPLAVERLSTVSGKYQTKICPVEHVRVGTYKDEHSGGNGWHNERGGFPRLIGAQWMSLAWKGTNRDGHLRPKFERAD